MFDRTYITKSTKEYVPYVKEEKRAPTDDSIRLYGEMLEKARASILRSMRTEGGTIDFTGFIYRDMPLGENILMVKLVLSGKTFEFKIPIEDQYIHNDTQIIHLVAERLSEKLTETIIKCMAKQILEA